MSVSGRIIDPILAKDLSKEQFSSVEWSSVLRALVLLRKATLCLMKATHLHPTIYQLYSLDERIADSDKAADSLYVSEDFKIPAETLRASAINTPILFKDLLDEARLQILEAHMRLGHVKADCTVLRCLLSEVEFAESTLRPSTERPSDLFWSCPPAVVVTQVELPIDLVRAWLDVLLRRVCIPMASYEVIRYIAEMIFLGNVNHENIRMWKYEAAREDVAAKEIFECGMNVLEEAESFITKCKAARSFFEYVYYAYLAYPRVSLAKRLFHSAQWRYEKKGHKKESEDLTKEAYAVEELAADCGAVVSSLGTQLLVVGFHDAIMNSVKPGETGRLRDTFHYVNSVSPELPNFALTAALRTIEHVEKRGTTKIFPEYKRRILSGFGDVDRELFSWANQTPLADTSMTYLKQVKIVDKETGQVLHRLQGRR